MHRHFGKILAVALLAWLLTSNLFPVGAAVDKTPKNIIDKNKEAQTQTPEPATDPGEMTVIPPRILLYPFFNKDIEHFSALIRNTVPIDPALIRISFLDNPGGDVEFFTNNIQWKKIGDYYYLTSIYGKPAEIPIVESFFKLDIGYRFKPGKHTRAQLDIVSGDIVLKTIPIDFITPFQLEYYVDKAVALVNRSAREKIAAGIIGLVLLWFLLDVFVIRKRRKKIPLCSTRARFSTLIEDNQTIQIGETKNPFGCRLGGLKKKVQISYKNSNIHVKIAGKKFTYPDKDTVSLDINLYWKLRIESQNYFGNDEKSHKNLVILLLPVNNL